MDIGKITSVKGKSVVDYVVCSPDVMSNIVKFEILEFNPMLSDVHCAINCVLKVISKNESNVVDSIPDLLMMK